MRRHIPGLHSWQPDDGELFEGLFLVRLDRAFFRHHARKQFLELHLAILEPRQRANKSFVARLCCAEKALGKFSWFLRDFGYDRELLNQDQIDVKALRGLKGVVRTSHFTGDGRAYQNLDSSAPGGQ